MELQHAGVLFWRVFRWSVTFGSNIEGWGLWCCCTVLCPPFLWMWVDKITEIVKHISTLEINNVFYRINEVNKRVCVCVCVCRDWHYVLGHGPRGRRWRRLSGQSDPTNGPRGSRKCASWRNRFFFLKNKTQTSKKKKVIIITNLASKLLLYYLLEGKKTVATDKRVWVIVKAGLKAQLWVFFCVFVILFIFSFSFFFFCYAHVIAGSGGLCLCKWFITH